VLQKPLEVDGPQRLLGLGRRSDQRPRRRAVVIQQPLHPPLRARRDLAQPRLRGLGLGPVGRFEPA
jgi:hypothetical protein